MPFCATVALDSAYDETLICTSCVNLCREALDAEWRALPGGGMVKDHSPIGGQRRKTKPHSHAPLTPEVVPIADRRSVTVGRRQSGSPAGYATWLGGTLNVFISRLGCHFMTQGETPTPPRSHLNGPRTGANGRTYGPPSLGLTVKPFGYWRGSSDRSLMGQSGCGDVSAASNFAIPSAITTRAFPSCASSVTGRFSALNRAVKSVMPHS